MSQFKEMFRPAKDAENSVPEDVAPDRASSPRLVDTASFGHAELAPRPTAIEQTGLSMDLLSDLTVKHLFNGGILTIAELTTSRGARSSRVGA